MYHLILLLCNIINQKPSSHRPIKGVSLQHVKLWGDYMEKVLLVLVISSTKSHRHVCQSRVCPFNMWSHGVITWKRSISSIKSHCHICQLAFGKWYLLWRSWQQCFYCETYMRWTRRGTFLGSLKNVICHSWRQHTLVLSIKTITAMAVKLQSPTMSRTCSKTQGGNITTRTTTTKMRYIYV